jgi:hypothetical protein
MMTAPTIAQLMRMTENEIIQMHDQLAARTEVDVRYCLDELARRENAQQVKSMRRLTIGITLLTIIVTVATIINVALTFLLYRRPLPLIK